MSYYEIIGEFINELQLIINTTAPELDKDAVDDIKVNAHEALYNILVKYNLIEPQ
jgi:hypothetical protein